MGSPKDNLNPVKLKNTLESIASMFETGRVKKMMDITTMYPTGVVAALGINYGGFMSKCASPEKFLMEDLVKMSHILKIDISLILDVVVKEALKNTPERKVDFLLND